METVVREICRVVMPEDGVHFDLDSVRAHQIREDAVYGGIRVTLTATLGTARIPVQIDVGFGDAVTPAPVEVEFPTLLDLPAPRLLAYPRQTAVAEKLEALVALGQDNSRMKDFYDLWSLSRAFAFDGPSLCEAVAATFARRKTPVSAATPVAFTPAFHEDTAKQAQWLAFVTRQIEDGNVPSLSALIEVLASFLMPVIDSVRLGTPFEEAWPPGGPWRPR
jgi:hypothetical protein